MKTIILIVIATLLMNGCAGTIDDVAPKNASAKSTMRLCAMYGLHGKYASNNLPNIKAELKRRKAFTKREWELIDNNQIQVGMSSEALTCSWGYPEKINRASYGNQSVYGNSYVYTENHKVTAWN